MGILNILMPATTDPADVKERLRLSHDQLRHTIDARLLPSREACAHHRSHIIGQDRAIEAMRLGLQLESPGYNIFLCGPSGSGRMTTARHVLREFREPRHPLHDFVYTYNFHEPDRARLLVLDPGEGLRLKRSMQKLIVGLRRKLPRALASGVRQRERDRHIAAHKKRGEAIINAFQRKLRQARFVAVEIEDGDETRSDVLPIIDGEPRTIASLEELVAQGKLSAARRTELHKRRNEFCLEHEQVVRRARVVNRELSRSLEDFDVGVATVVIDELVDDLREQFPGAQLKEYIDEVRESLVERIPIMLREESEAKASGESEAARGLHQLLEGDYLAPFQVNVVLTNVRSNGCPMVFEQTPSLVRLFGTIERALDGSSKADVEFMNVRAGALLRADGGFLVVDAEDLISEPGAWKALKRTLASGHLDVRTPEGFMAMMPSGLKPDPIPLNVKIIMLGDEDVYRALYLTEDDFKKIFKMKAEFDVEMDLSAKSLEKFGAFVTRVVTEEKLLPPSRPALASLVEEALRDVENQSKISTRFRVTADLLRESTYWARQGDRQRIAPADVNRALAERYRRVSLAEEKYRESIERNQIIVETSGQRTGQVNGLAVFDFGDYCFGKPCRITAAVGLGRDGIINIERESGLSGETHDKGIYILGGFLRGRFGKKIPLALAASVCFEQSYGPIDGDSASSTEVYALLSALGDLPLEQGIAVTGSVSQIGEIQPIGGINQKIEGFFEICQTRGLTGTQGVLIPRRNVSNLMLHEEVIEAVRQKAFHIYAVSTVDEGMEILTGVRAGIADQDGVFPPESVNGRVAARLRSMAEEMRKYQ